MLLVAERRDDPDRVARFLGGRSERQPTPSSLGLEISTIDLGERPIRQCTPPVASLLADVSDPRVQFMISGDGRGRADLAQPRQVGVVEHRNELFGRQVCCNRRLNSGPSVVGASGNRHQQDAGHDQRCQAHSNERSSCGPGADHPLECSPIQGE